MSEKRYLILAEGQSGDPHYGKTMRGVVGYGPNPTVAILDSQRRGRDRRRRSRSSATVAEALPYEPTTALVGVATAGRALPAGLARPAEGLDRAGLDLESGLHEFISDDPELVAARSARTASSCATCASRPPDLNVPTGENLELAGARPCSPSAPTARSARRRSRSSSTARRARAASKSQFVPTGQTGIAIAGWGIAIDAVVADFIAGAAERLVVEGAARGGELLFVEGQGSLSHPAYSGVTLGLIHGSAPHAYVLCHVAGATEIEGYPGYPLPPLREIVELHERIVASVASGSGRGDRAQHARSRRRRGPRRGVASGGGNGPAGRRSGPVRCGSKVLDAVLSRSAILIAEGLMRNGLPAAARLTLACVLGALFLAPAAAADIRVGVADDHPKGSPEVAARFYDAMKDVGLTENRITLLWDSAHPTTIDGQDNLDRGDPGRAGRRRPHHARHLSVAREGADRVARRPRKVRRLRGARRADVPDGQGLHHRQRAEQVAVLAAAVQHERHARRLRGDTSPCWRRPTTR